MPSVFIAILNSDFAWLWSPETQRRPLTLCRVVSAHVYTYACMFGFFFSFFFYCMYCKCACAQLQERQASANNYK